MTLFSVFTVKKDPVILPFSFESIILFFSQKSMILEKWKMSTVYIIIILISLSPFIYILYRYVIDKVNKFYDLIYFIQIVC